MRILHVNKYHYIRGGAERYLFDVARRSVRRGDEVAVFRMHHPSNVHSPWSQFDAPGVQTTRAVLGWDGLRTASTVLYSLPARRRMAQMIRTWRPDVVHVHNVYHQLSTSVLDAIRAAGVPAVMTTHDFGLLAPNHALFHDGAVCVRSLKHPLRALPHRCVKGSYLASAVAGIDRWISRRRRVYERTIARFLAPSEFLRATLEAHGLRGRIQHLPLGVDLDRFPTLGPPTTRSVLFVGRLAEGKGIDVLLDAAARLRDLPFRIVGSGELEPHLWGHAEALGLSNVTFCGFKTGRALLAELERSAVVVVPSVWHEVFGLAAAEALVAGRPVVASAVGGLREVVRDGHDGVLVEPGSAEALAEAIRAVVDRPGLCGFLARGAARDAPARFSLDRHCDGLQGAYVDP